MCRACECPRLIFPVAVRRTRLAAPLWVLSLGINCSFPFNCRFPIADCQLIPIGNWQSEIGNNLLSGRRLRLRAAALVSLWSKNDEHLVPFHPWPRFNLTNIDEIALEPLQNSRA